MAIKQVILHSYYCDFYYTLIISLTIVLTLNWHVQIRTCQYTNPIIHRFRQWLNCIINIVTTVQTERNQGYISLLKTLTRTLS
jgi:hypothetical protein